MGIGTSLGTYHDDMFGLWQSGLNAQALANSTVDKQMVTTPDDLQGNKAIAADPSNITDDSGSIVDYQDPIDTLNSLPPSARNYNTPLTTEQQSQYNSKFGVQDSEDYDMQGFFKANPDVDPHTDGTHYPDTYKKPNHPTFSDESQYSNQDTQGGHWGQEDGKDTFTPGAQNLKNFTPDQLKDYFNRVEPDVKLNLPDQ